MVDDHRLVVTFVGQLHLVDEPLLLVERVVELGVGVGQLLTVDHELEALCQAWLRTVHLRQRRHLNRIVDDECRLDIRALAEVAKDLVDELTLAHGIRDGIHLELVHGDVADLFLCLVGEVIAGLLLDGVEDRDAWERSFVADDLAVGIVNLRRAVDSDTDRLKHLLRERHHPFVILVGHVELHERELRVVVLVHTLVAESLADLVDTLKATDDEAFQIQLQGDTQIHVGIEGVIVRDERAGGGTTGDGLQHRSLYLRVPGIVEEFAHGADDGSAVDERLLHAIVDNQVHVALAGAHLRVIKLVVSHAVLIFHDRQWLKTLREQRELLCVNRDLAGLCLEHEAADADNVADVKQFLEDRGVHIFVLTRADVVTGDIDLDTAFAVLKLHEAGFAHDTAAHHTSGDDDLRLLSLLEVLLDVGAESCYGELSSGVGVDAHLAQLLQALAAANLLLTQL